MKNTDQIDVVVGLNDCTSVIFNNEMSVESFKSISSAKVKCFRCGVSYSTFRFKHCCGDKGRTNFKLWSCTCGTCMTNDERDAVFDRYRL